ncbi:DNA-directed DNA polymerase [Handroanthus impetiginosus]|uniref:DNA-directed DNA polymerase n=1 Tax=Handroanthus impetiginosus TaxID=429701 RepID=A0A2G9GZZ4_9LAMI|nr:DNA-directed DNA polymerase [Handroanthus impetiginosus]
MFRQGVTKIVYEAWSRFKKMLWNCSKHDILRHIQVHTFYHGLTDGGKDKLDHLNGGSFLSETIAKCHNLLNNLVANHYEKNLEWATPLKSVIIRKFQNNPYSNTYNPGWRQHPNFSWSNNQGQGSAPRFQQGVLRQVQQPIQEKKPSLEEMLMQFMASTSSRKQTKMKGKEVISEENKKEVEASFEISKHITLQLLFPQRPQNFKKLHINILFAEAFEQMPSYVKFMKDILSKKRRLGDYEMVTLTEEYSVIIQNKLPPKLKDPGSFTIPNAIGTHFSKRASCNLRASINLIPYSIYRTLRLGKAKPISITLQLADRSLTYLKKVIEYILVKVDKFIFPADFIVLDIEVNSEIPIIHERPFLATSRTLIDVKKGELTMRVQDQQIMFNVFKAMKFPNESNECFSISIFDNLAGREAFTERPLDLVEHALLDTLDASKCFKPKGVESLERTAPSKVLKPLIEEPPTLELKHIPNHLRYVYLGESDTLPVIIQSSLSDVQVEKLLRVLKDHKGTIEWIIADIRGINPSFCMQKYFLKMIKTLCGKSKKAESHHEGSERNFYCFLDGYSGYNQIAIASEYQEKTIFTCLYVYRNSFDEYLNNLSLVLKRCEDINLVLKWKKIPLYGTRGIVLGHKVCNTCIEIDKAKLKTIEKLALPTSVKGIRSFLGHAGFYRSFIKDFSKISKPLCNLLEKDVPFKFDDAYLHAFNELKGRLIFAPIITILDWAFLFELCVMQKRFLFKQCFDNILRYCVPEVEINDILKQCHASPYGVHFQGDKIAAKILQSGFYWPTLFKDAHSFVANCERCHRIGNISKRYEMPLNTILEVELFNVWGIDFMGLFVPPPFW